MAKRLILASNALAGSVGGMRQFDLGQGVDATLAPFPAAFPRSAPVQSNSNLALSPNGDFMVLATGSANDWAYFTDPSDLNSYTTMSSPSFAGIVYCCAVSQTHFAIGGNAPALYVFDRATRTLQSLSTAGITQVGNLSFSPDGSRLAVHHSTSPYLRIYKTSDWTYVDAVAAGAQGAVTGSHLAFNADGSKVISSSGSSPYLSVHDAVTGARLMNQTSTTYNSRRIKPHNTDPNTAFIGRASNAPTCLAEVNLTTGALTDFTGLASVTCSGLEVDFDERVAYAVHNTTNGRNLTVYSLDTRAVLSSQPDAIRQVMTDGALRAMVLLDSAKHTITGAVRDINNLPVLREILAFERSTGILRARTFSNATTGSYVLRLPNAGPYDVQFKIQDGDQLEDLFFARSEPQPV